MAAQTVENGGCADADQASAHQNVAYKENEDDEGVDGSEDEEAGRVHHGPEALVGRDGGHDVGVGLAQQLVHGDNLNSRVRAALR